MAFTCSLCGLDIVVGELMLGDDKMNLAHKTCVERGRSVDPPSTIVVKAKVSGPGFGNPTAIIEPCLPPSAPKVCVECQKPAISMCPACLVRVHQNYGYDGATACSTLHEAKCDGARKSRDRNEKPADAVKVTSVPKNGKHKTSNPKRRKK